MCPPPSTSCVATTQAPLPLHSQTNGIITESVALSFILAPRAAQFIRQSLVAQVAARDVEFGATPLHWAAAVGDEEVVRLLLHKGADVKARPTPHLAATDAQ